MSWSFLITSLVVVATPGTGVVYTLGAGLVRGRRAAVWAAFACTLGIVPHLLAAISGLAAVLHASAALYGVVVWAGVAYLLHLAWSTWRSAGGEGLGVDGVAARTPGGVLRDGIVLNVLNPKLTVFFVAFLPQFVGGTRPAEATVQMAALGALFMMMTWVVFAVYGITASVLRPVLIRRPSLLAAVMKGFSGCYVLLAVVLAVEHLR
ncbi:LysE family translocator [Cellulosimicrobium cellulans]|uniref:LysE family translocator n=1 Tax=Cellulosimicrobium cellulans TaxID=1710 RepID=UPI00130EA144|nr:LysE family translocator [Cellulosimicrobium cellulans]